MWTGGRFLYGAFPQAERERGVGAYEFGAYPSANHCPPMPTGRPGRASAILRVVLRSLAELKFLLLVALSAYSLLVEVHSETEGERCKRMTADVCPSERLVDPRPRSRATVSFADRRIAPLYAQNAPAMRRLPASKLNRPSWHPRGRDGTRRIKSMSACLVALP